VVEAIKSDDYGYYQFNNLPAGDYVVRASPHGPDPSGIWVITTPAFNNVHLEAMQVYNDANFGYAHPGEGGRISTSVGGKQAMPAEFALHSNYPNPFNPSTTIRYDLPRAQRVILAVYDMLGREIRILVDHRQEAGSYEVRLDASGLPSGVYLVHFQTEEYRSMRRMTLTK
jgi:hypothetical protein